ncbi:MAG: hypothetical protein AB7U82_02530 [Blastocatellales bacterium]
MRIRYLSLALIVSSLAVVALAGFGQKAVMAQITFVQTPQNRNQTQNQRGLPPEKKKSLSRYGPEDVFPGVNQQEESRGRNSGQRQRSRRASTSRPASAPRQSPTPAATPVLTPSSASSQPATAKPSPTLMAVLGNQFQQAAPARQSSSTQSASPWTVPVLSGLALIVSIALIYVLTRLIEKIREDSRV